jgi:hypothetical protein
LCVLLPMRAGAGAPLEDIAAFLGGQVGSSGHS